VALIAGGKHAIGPHEAWIAADPFRGGFKVLITGRRASSARWCSRWKMKSP
jgi:hypothetical protein